MKVTDEQMAHAEAALQKKRVAGHSMAARYEAASERPLVSIYNDVELAIPVRLVEGPTGAAP